MSERELVEEARRRIKAFSELPPDEQIRRLIKKGTINEKGEVLMGLEEEKNYKPSSLTRAPHLASVSERHLEEIARLLSG